MGDLTNCSNALVSIFDWRMATFLKAHIAISEQGQGGDDNFTAYILLLRIHFCFKFHYLRENQRGTLQASRK